MDIILLEKIRNLGELGEKVSVANGYGRNFLIPQGKAVRATKDNVAYFEERRAELEKNAADKLAQAEARAEKINETSVEIARQAGDEGKLFGSVGPRDIAEALTAKGVDVNKAEVKMPEGPIRNTGEFEVTVLVHSDVEATAKVVVIAEE